MPLYPTHLQKGEVVDRSEHRRKFGKEYPVTYDICKECGGDWFNHYDADCTDESRESGGKIRKGYQSAEGIPIRIGDEVKLVSAIEGERYILERRKGEIYEVVTYKGRGRLYIRSISGSNLYWNSSMVTVLSTVKGGNSTMSDNINNTIAKVYEQTRNARVVNKYFSKTIPDSLFGECVLSTKENKKKFLDEARRLEAKAKAKK